MLMYESGKLIWMLMYMYIYIVWVMEEIYVWFYFFKNLKNELIDEED